MTIANTAFMLSCVTGFQYFHWDQGISYPLLAKISAAYLFVPSISIFRTTSSKNSGLVSAICGPDGSLKGALTSTTSVLRSIMHQCQYQCSRHFLGSVSLRNPFHAPSTMTIFSTMNWTGSLWPLLRSESNYHKIKVSNNTLITLLHTRLLPGHNGVATTLYTCHHATTVLILQTVT